ncbi:unnamed protein product [Paramecium primaurelia]|uniref:Uncharacterized protein n=1 Tax=Paramecium primaurelia TaxID=5886 RepID=A0A8S1PJ20_PARPR|nr:unnamed protein product [Paramecium primaurelia]
MVQVLLNCKMVLFFKVSGRIISSMDLEKKYIRMEIFIVDIGMKGKFMVIENIIINKVQLTQDIGKIVQNISTERNHGLMEPLMRENTMKGKRMGEVS